jgi:hypothetical protein
MLFVALSCLQGRPMQAAFDELARLGTGVQLTPGNLPAPGFREYVRASGVATRRHHGFAWDARKQATWAGDGACLVDSESVHPPEEREAGFAGWRAWYEAAAVRPVVEVMYPGYALGTGAEVERAMADRLPLAVDISHVFIQLEQGAMTRATWDRLADYDGIAEVHVSANRGGHDTHLALADSTFGLAWACARLAAGTPTVLECYMHRLTTAERCHQIDLIRDNLAA